MSVLIKICGLKTPEALDVALEAGADWSASCFSRLAAPCRASRSPARSARRCGAGRRRLRFPSMPATTSSPPRIEALRPDLLQLHGKETPDRVAAVRAALRAAGDEGAADRRASTISSPIRLYDQGGGPFDLRRAGRRATPPGRAASARASTGGCSTPLRRPCRSCSRAASMPATSPRRCASRRARCRCFLRRRARARREGPGQDPRVHRCGRDAQARCSAQQKLTSGA